MEETGECSEGQGAESMESAEPSLLQKILATLEFYFSDINLSRNKFLAHKVLENPCKQPQLCYFFNKNETNLFSFCFYFVALN